MRAAILLTCFNRKDKTLACLRSIQSQLPIKGLEWVIYLVDDGSTDQTGKFVSEAFPSVKLLNGDGSLYWNGGMNLAWKAARENSFDFYIWINDDVDIKTDAFLVMFDSYEKGMSISNSPPVIVGCFREPDTKEHAYGGFSVKRTLFSMKTERKVPSGLIEACDSFNGNLVLIPNRVVEKIGLLDERYTHSFGDKDYGYRCTRNGVPIFITPTYVGECARNSIAGTWMDPSVSIRERYRRLTQPNGLPPTEYFYSYLKNSNAFVGSIAMIKLYLRLLFPNLWQRISAKKGGE